MPADPHDTAQHWRVFPDHYFVRPIPQIGRQHCLDHIAGSGGRHVDILRERQAKAEPG
jgi:hypothetical protein